MTLGNNGLSDDHVNLPPCAAQTPDEGPELRAHSSSSGPGDTGPVGEADPVEVIYRAECGDFVAIDQIKENGRTIVLLLEADK